MECSAMLKFCLKLGLINHLILDTDCADELHRLAR
jgi:hypothetical protein